ncbi:MAG: glycosyltransferase family 4 protein [Anaerolineae bacterium]
MPNRILHVIDHTDSGGAQVLLYYLILALKDRFSFTVAVIGKSGRFTQMYRDLGVPVILLDELGSRWSPLPLITLTAELARHRYDLIHNHLFKASILGMVSSRLSGCKCIVHDHTGIYPESLKYIISNPIVRYIYLIAYSALLNRVSQVIVLTSGMQQAYLENYRIDPRKITLLPNAIDIRAFERPDRNNCAEELCKTLGLSTQTKLVTMIGRLDPEKDWQTFLGVARLVTTQFGMPCAFLVVGSGSQDRELRTRVRAEGLDRVIFLGYREDIPDLLSQSDVFLLTSRREPFGIVLLEAMAAGCPIVATRSGGPESILTNGVDALLADVGDVQGLAEIVMRILEDTDLARELATRARRKVLEHYSQDVFMEKMVAMYRDVIGA